jgi:DNA polymerase-1
MRTYVKNGSQLMQMVDTIMGSSNPEKVYSFDIETVGLKGNRKDLNLDPYRNKIVSFAFAIPNRQWFVPFRKNDVGELTLEEALHVCAPLFDAADYTMIGHNLKFDIKNVIFHSGNRTPINNKLFDTMVADWLLFENRKRHSLDVVAKEHLGVEMMDYDESRNMMLFNSEGKEFKYACDDVEVPMDLYKFFKPLLEKEKLEKVFYDIEMEYIPVLIEMELKGVLGDVAKLKEYDVMLSNKMIQTELEAYSLVGERFMMSSPLQVRNLLFSRLNLEVPEEWYKEGKSGEASTGADVLESIRHAHPVVQKILDWRGYQKLRDSFVRPLLGYADIYPDKRMRPHYKNAHVVSGRLSIVDPPLQTIPREKNLLRQAFIAPDGRTLVCADFGQIELRLMAHCSKDPILLRAYSNGEDIHQKTADICGCSRQYAKIINFGLIYGMGASTLAHSLRIDIEEARAFRKRYFEEYRGVTRYHNHIENLLNRGQVVRTVCGRARHFPMWKWKEDMTFGYKMGLLRQAINSTIQGSAADLLKLSQRNIRKRMIKEGLPGFQILQVHDEVLVECDEEVASAVRDIVEYEMANVVKLRIPLEVSAHIGKTWEAAKG